MPSQLAVPTIADLLAAGHAGIKGELDEREDSHSGSVYEYLLGPGAILFQRAALRDRDLFRAVYDGTAAGPDLTTRLQTRYGVARLVDAFGAGLSHWVRKTAGAGAGTIFAGTRIYVYGVSGRTTPLIYKVVSDVTVGSSDLDVQDVEICATFVGPGSAIDTSSATDLRIVIADPLWDSTWTLSSLVCGDGTRFELADDYRARVKQDRLDGRVGYRKSIVNACLAAGASHVALFASNYSGAANDYGINVVYVGDQNHTGTPALIQACTLALEDWRVAGADLAVLPMATAALTVYANVFLRDAPANVVNQDDIASQMIDQLVDYFAPEQSGWAYRLDALSAAMTRGLDDVVQQVAFASPLVDLTIQSGTPPAFPQTLTKWSLTPQSVFLSLFGPQ